MPKPFKSVLLAMLLSLLAGAVQAQELQVKSFGATFNAIYATANPVSDIHGTPCAALVVQTTRDDIVFEDDFLVEQRKLGPGEYLLYMGNGARKLRVYVPGFIPFEILFRDYNTDYPELRSKQNYIIVLTTNIELPRKKLSSSFFIEAGFSYFSFMGPHLSIGTNLSGFNMQFDAILPVGSPQTVCWNHLSQESEQCSYKPSISLAGRLGYAIRMGSTFRLIPQLGLRFLKTSETPDDATVQHASGAYMSSLLIAAKLQFMFSKHVGISLTPEYAVPILKSEGFEALTSASDNISGWNNGLGASLSLNIEF